MKMNFSDANSPPKLALYSIPNTEPAGMLTPPLRAPSASVPFKWEESPGKPRSAESKTEAARSLELPPRLLSMASPTTVLDGPYYPGQNIARLSSLRSFRSPDSMWKERGRFGSSRWSSFRRSKEVFVVDGSCSNGSKERIKSVGRMGSFLSISHNKKWGRIYESFKQAVIPWRRPSRQDKLRNMTN